METHPTTTEDRANRQYLEFSERQVERGAKQVVRDIRRACANWIWAFGNLPRNHFQAVCGLLSVVHSAELAVQKRQGVPKTEAPCDELKEDLSDAFVGRFANPELMYVAHVVEQWRIPKQLVFEPLEAHDRIWRFGQPQTHEQAMGTATRLGGAMMQQLVRVLEPEKPGFESSAMKIGQALTLAWWLWRMVEDAAEGKTIRIPLEDLINTKIDVEMLKARQSQKGLHHLVRLYGHRIDVLLNEGGPLFGHLGFDGKRVLKTLLAICWRGLSNVRLNPDRLLRPGQALGDRELFALRARHFLGLDGALPFGNDSHDAH